MTAPAQGRNLVPVRSSQRSHRGGGWNGSNRQQGGTDD
jgi:hypothetical protein